MLREPLPTRILDGTVYPFKRVPTFKPCLCEYVTKRDPAKRRREVALKTLAQLPHPDVIVNTDGSVLVLRLSLHGGGGFHLVDSNGVEHRERTPAGKLCNSCRAEMHGLLFALGHLTATGSEIAVKRGAEIQILTDSQSSIVSLMGGPLKQSTHLGQRIWPELAKVEQTHDAHVTLAFVPGHVSLEGNTESDKGSRGQERVIAQLRAGKCPIVGEYQKLCGFSDTAACACGAAVDSVRHLMLDCPLYEGARQRMFATQIDRTLSILALEPERVLTFLRTIGREGCAALKAARATAPAGPSPTSTTQSTSPTSTTGGGAACSGALGRSC